MKSAALLLLAIFWLSPAGAENDYVEVGTIPVQCPIKLTVANNFTMPKGWEISPLEAVALASKKGLVKCNNPFLQAVYADQTSYYIVKPVFGPINSSVPAVVINGQTGLVSVRGKHGS